MLWWSNEKRRGDSAVSAQRPHLLSFLCSLYLSRSFSLPFFWSPFLYRSIYRGCTLQFLPVYLPPILHKCPSEEVILDCWLIVEGFVGLQVDAQFSDEQGLMANVTQLLWALTGWYLSILINQQVATFETASQKWNSINIILISYRVLQKWCIFVGQPGRPGSLDKKPMGFSIGFWIVVDNIVDYDIYKCCSVK